MNVFSISFAQRYKDDTEGAKEDQKLRPKTYEFDFAVILAPVCANKVLTFDSILK